MATLKLGTDILLLMSTDAGVTYVPTAYAKSHTLNIKSDTINTRSKDSGVWTDKLAGVLDWTISCEALMSYDTTDTGYEELFDAMIAQSVVKLVSSVGEQETGTVYYEGEAIITGLDFNAPDNEIASYSVTFEGTGALAKATAA